MSALLAPSPKTTRGKHDPGRARPRLRPLATPPRRMARLPFLTVLIAAFGLGMGGLLLLNTTLQNQAFQARVLSRQATELTYVQSDLEGQLDAVAAPGSLALKASELGMRANPYPAFVVLPSGTVVGHPKAVAGGEVPSLVVKSPEQLAVEQSAAEAGAATAAQASVQREIAAAQAARARAEAAAAKQAAEKKAAAAKQAAEQKAAAAKQAAAKKQTSAKKGN